MKAFRDWPEKRKKIFIYFVLAGIGIFLFWNYLNNLKASFSKIFFEEKNFSLPTLAPELKREEEEIQENLKSLFEIFQK